MSEENLWISIGAGQFEAHNFVPFVHNENQINYTIVCLSEPDVFPQGFFKQQSIYSIENFTWFYLLCGVRGTIEIYGMKGKYVIMKISFDFHGAGGPKSSHGFLGPV